MISNCVFYCKSFLFTPRSACPSASEYVLAGRKTLLRRSGCRGQHLPQEIAGCDFLHTDWRQVWSYFLAMNWILYGLSNFYTGGHLWLLLCTAFPWGGFQDAWPWEGVTFSTFGRFPFRISKHANITSIDKRQVRLGPFPTLWCQNLKRGSAPRKKQVWMLETKGHFACLKA